MYVENAHPPMHRLKKSVGNVFDGIMDWLLPRHCLMCGRPSVDSNLCHPCWEDLPRTGAACDHCGLPLEGEKGRLCGACLERRPPWDRVISALDYRFPVDTLVRRFKFNRCMACGDTLARVLAQKLENSTEPGTRPEVIAPVPLHRARLATRTFNQSDLIARLVGRRLGIPVEIRLLSRVRKTHAQTDLDARARRRNTHGAFHCHYQRVGKVRHLALVDDVMTTGATIEACTRELKRAGIREVSAWVVARAPPP